MLVLAQLSAH